MSRGGSWRGEARAALRKAKMARQCPPSAPSLTPGMAQGLWAGWLAKESDEQNWKAVLTLFAELSCCLRCCHPHCNFVGSARSGHFYECAQTSKYSVKQVYC